MSRLVFFRGANVEHGDVVLTHQSAQLLERHRLKLIVAIEIRLHDLLHFGEPAVAERLEAS